MHIGKNPTFLRDMDSTKSKVYLPEVHATFSTDENAFKTERVWLIQWGGAEPNITKD